MNMEQSPKFNNNEEQLQYEQDVTEEEENISDESLSSSRDRASLSREYTSDEEIQTARGIVNKIFDDLAEDQVGDMESEVVKFATVFRVVPSGAIAPCVDANCWASGEPQANLLVEGKKLLEIEIVYNHLDSYQDDQSGGVDGVGYDSDEDWWSFTTRDIVRWREYGKDEWVPGMGYNSYKEVFEARQREEKKIRRKERMRMIDPKTGVDYEKLLQEEGLGELEI